jgi:hypothetical protein
MPGNTRASWVIAAALLGACGGVDLRAQQAPEDRVRAAFLYQLAQYVTWPQETPSKEPFRICVYGYEGFSSTLETVVQSKRIDNRPVRVLNLKLPEEIARCQMVYLGFESRREIAQFMGRWHYPPVLVVGESDGFAELGGMVNLVLDAGRVNFEVNLAATRRAGVSLRSQLLRFAKLVQTGGAPR